MKSQNYILAALLLVLAVSFSSTSFAATTTVKVKTGQEADKAKIISRADQEISRRIAALDDLSKHISEMKHVQAEVKSSLTSALLNEVASLTTLKVKIDAGTDLAILKADVQSITKSYRIFALILPQGHILAAADRITHAANLLTELTLKLKGRVEIAKSEGNEVAALEKLIIEIEAKIVDAKTQAEAAQKYVGNLTPDNGDALKAKANKEALLKGRADIRVGTQDLITARKDAREVIKGLKALQVTASSSASTTVTTTP